MYSQVAANGQQLCVTNPAGSNLGMAQCASATNQLFSGINTDRVVIESTANWWCGGARPNPPPPVMATQLIPTKLQHSKLMPSKVATDNTPTADDSAAAPRPTQLDDEQLVPHRRQPPRHVDLLELARAAFLPKRRRTARGCAAGGEGGTSLVGCVKTCARLTPPLTFG